MPYSKSTSVPYQKAYIQYKTEMTMHWHCISAMIKSMKKYCSVPVKSISNNTVTWISPNNYVLAVISKISIECRFFGYTDARNITPSLAVITLPEGCLILTPRFVILVVKTFQSKMSILLWDYQFHPFVNLSSHCSILNWCYISSLLISQRQSCNWW